MIIRCTIEMDMIPEEHFHNAENDSEDMIIEAAKQSFLDTVNQLDNDGDLYEYVQVKVIREEEYDD